jgi:hypothetical protein
MAWESPEDVGRLLFSPSGLLLATTRCGGDDDRRDVLRLYDALRGRELGHAEGLAPSFALAFTSVRELVIIEEHRCLLWGPDTGEARTLWEDADDPTWAEVQRFTGGTASPDGKLLALALESMILVIDLPSGKVRHRLQTPAETEVWYDDLALAGPYLAAICRAERHVYTFAILWDLMRGRRLRTYDLTPLSEPYCLTLHPQGEALAVAENGAIYAYGLDGEDVLDGFKPFRSDRTFALQYSTDGRALEAVSGQRALRLDARTGKAVEALKLPTAFDWPRAAIDPAGDKVALAQGQNVEVWDLADL